MENQVLIGSLIPLMAPETLFVAFPLGPSLSLVSIILKLSSAQSWTRFTMSIFFARRYCGTFLNGAPIRASGHTKLSDGLMGLGTSSLNGTNPFPALAEELFGHDSLFVKIGSGTFGLTYAACGRDLAYMEDHMKSWDCLAGILLAEEAGAIVHGFDFDSIMKQGSRVIVATPGVFHQVRSISQKVLE